MKNITHSQVQELVASLPLTKLPVVYDLLLELISGDSQTTSPQEAFMFLPLVERHRLMAEQAEQMVAYYQETETIKKSHSFSASLGAITSGDVLISSVTLTLTPRDSR